MDRKFTTAQLKAMTDDDLYELMDAGECRMSNEVCCYILAKVVDEEGQQIDEIYAEADPNPAPVDDMYEPFYDGAVKELLKAAHDQIAKL